MPDSVFDNVSARTVRLTVPPAQPLEPQPVFRGAMGGNERTWQAGVELQAPVPLAIPLIPQPSYTPTAGVQLGAPVRIQR